MFNTAKLLELALESLVLCSCIFQSSACLPPFSNTFHDIPEKVREEEMITSYIMIQKTHLARCNNACLDVITMIIHLVPPPSLMPLSPTRVSHSSRRLSTNAWSSASFITYNTSLSLASCLPYLMFKMSLSHYFHGSTMNIIQTERSCDIVVYPLIESWVTNLWMDS